MPGVDSTTSMPPDPEIVLRTWLLSKSTITNEISQRVATKLPQNPTPVSYTHLTLPTKRIV